MKKLILCITPFLLASCSKRTAFDLFSVDTYYEKSIFQMKKLTLKDEGNTKVLLHVVYLNGVDKDSYGDKEYFYLAVQSQGEKFNPENVRLSYMEEIKDTEVEKWPSEVSIEKQTMIKHDFKPLGYKVLPKDDGLRKNIPINAQWNEFYLVEFEKLTSEALMFEYESDLYGAGQLSFQVVK